jgi:glycosyltransferase involved in cell wall biosynthesis
MYCYESIDYIITVSKSECDYLTRILRIKPEKIFYNNLALPDFYFSTKKFTEKKKIITFCGRWTLHKGNVLIENAISVILKKYPDYKFRLIGVGEEFEINKYFVKDVVTQIEVFPFVKDKEKLMDLYLESSVFLFPSLTESFGLVVAEAMYCGCATITGKTGYAAELMNNEEAIVLQELTSVNIIDALDLLINDSELRDKISKLGHSKSSILTWENYNSELKIIIKSITK